MRRPVILSILIASLVGGCSFNLGSLTAASTKNVPLPQTMVKRAVEGKDCAHMFLFIPLGSLNPNFQEAADNALSTAPGANALADVAIYSEPLFLYIYNRNCIRVRGDAVKIGQLGEVRQ
jgi:hypothetical protein